MKKKFSFAVLIIVILVIFSFLRDFAIKSIVQTVITNVTGAPTDIGNLSLSIIGRSVTITNFKIYNPKGFPREILADIPKIEVALNILPIFQGKIHLRTITLNIKEIGLTKNKDGVQNVDALKISQKKKEAGKKEGMKSSQGINLQIDIANLAMGRIINKNYSVYPPVVRVFDINLKKTYKDIKSVQQFAALIISEPLKAAGIGGLKVYGAAMLTGVAALPIAAAFTFAGKDYAEEYVSAPLEKTYAVAQKILQESGKIKKEDKTGSIINAEVGGAGVTLKLTTFNNKKTHIIVFARKFGLPKPEIASGIIYKIINELK